LLLFLLLLHNAATDGLQFVVFLVHINACRCGHICLRTVWRCLSVFANYVRSISQ